MTAPGPYPYALAEYVEDDVAGTISVAPRVLIEMIEVATLSLPATARIVGGRRGAVRKAHVIAEGPAGKVHDDWISERGIKVRIQGDTLEAAVNVELRQGASVPDVAAQIRTEVGLVVEKMLGLRTESVAVHVVGFDPDVVPE